MRLTAEIWISAYIKRLSLLEIPAFIVAKGDVSSGAVLIKMNTLDGQACCYQRSFDLMSGQRVWIVLSEGAENVVDVSIQKKLSFDPDLWVIEVEDREGRHLLGEDGLG